METKFSINSEIDPGVGIDGLSLLENVSILRSYILDVDVIIPFSNKQGNWSMQYVYPDWVEFSYKNSINVYSCVYNGLITRIELTKYFEGKIKNTNIGIGSIVSDLNSNFTSLTFDDGLLEINDKKISFEIDDIADFDSIDDILDKKITKIILHSNYTECT